MAKRAKNIKVVLHLPEDLESAFNRKEVVDFWCRVNLRLLHENGVTSREQLEKLMEEVKKQ